MTNISFFFFTTSFKYLTISFVACFKELYFDKIWKTMQEKNCPKMHIVILKTIRNGSTAFKLSRKYKEQNLDLFLYKCFFKIIQFLNRQKNLIIIKNFFDTTSQKSCSANFFVLIEFLINRHY